MPLDLLCFLVGWEIAEWVELWTCRSRCHPEIDQLSQKIFVYRLVKYVSKVETGRTAEVYYGTFQKKNQLKVMGTKNLSTNLTKPTVASSPLDAETLVTRSYHSFLTLTAAVVSNSMKSLLVSKISGSFFKQATAIPSCRH